MKKNIYKQKNAMNIIFIHTYIATSIHHIYSYHIHIYIEKNTYMQQKH